MEGAEVHGQERMGEGLESLFKTRETYRLEPDV
jgi:hypothetical protein